MWFVRCRRCAYQPCRSKAIRRKKPACLSTPCDAIDPVMGVAFNVANLKGDIVSRYTTLFNQLFVGDRFPELIRVYVVLHEAAHMIDNSTNKSALRYDAEHGQLNQPLSKSETYADVRALTVLKASGYDLSGIGASGVGYGRLHISEAMKEVK